MSIVRYQWEEMILLRLIELNSLMPHYWSELFILSFQLFSDDELESLKHQIRDVELMIFLPEEIMHGLSLYDIEMSLESNPDFHAFFERHDGVKVTKFDVERRLDKIRQWIFERVRDKARSRRFSRFR